MGGLQQRYDPRSVYLIFILLFCIYIWYSASEWTKPVLQTARCLSDQIGTGADGVMKRVHKNEKYLIVITPTYQRLTQIPDLLRMKQSLMLVDKVVWIVIEDSGCRHDEVYQSLQDFPRLIYLNQKLSDAPSSYNKGAQQRNLAIKLIHSHFGGHPQSVVYFADDDNTYNSALLPRLLTTKNMSVFNVGLVNEDVEGPMADSNGKFANWRTKYMGRFFNKKRKFCIDMAGFAVTVDQLVKANAFFDPQGTRGYLETDFLEMFSIKLSQLEVLTANFTEIVAWHTKTSYMVANNTVLAVVWYSIKNAVYFFLAYILVIVCLHRMKLMKS